MEARRQVIATLFTAVMVFATLAAVDAAPASARAGGSGDHHCVSPEGVDANELLGISQQIFQPDACNVVLAGDSYVPLGFPGFWWVNTFWETVPADYTPSAPTPIEDFRSKVRSVTFVVDPGTKHERSYRFAAQDVMDVRTFHDFFPESGPDWPTALFLAELPPLPPGNHHLGTLIEMTARHCDGLGSDTATNCLSAGTTRLTVCPFTVVSRSAWSKDRG